MNKCLLVVFAIIVLILLFGIAYYFRQKAITKKYINEVFHANILKVARENDNFRNVLATASQSQVVLMSILPGECIGKESHDVDQVLIFTEGTGVAEIGDKNYPISAGDLFMVPAYAVHNFTNTGKDVMKLFTIYAPAEHKQGLIQKTKPAHD